MLDTSQKKELAEIAEEFGVQYESVKQTFRKLVIEAEAVYHIKRIVLVNANI